MKKNVKKCFKNLHISKKSCIFASKFSNLCYIIVVFMKKRQDCLVYKYVYKKVPFRGGFWRKHKFNDDLTSLSSDFPVVAFVSQTSNRFKLFFVSLDDEYTIWSDKHGNIIVRILRKNIIQTKINF